MSNNNRIVVVGQSAKDMISEDNILSRNKNLDLLKQWQRELDYPSSRQDKEEK